MNAEDKIRFTVAANTSLPQNGIIKHITIVDLLIKYLD